jgi:hypothetical protein
MSSVRTILKEPKDYLNQCFSEFEGREVIQTSAYEF